MFSIVEICEIMVEIEWLPHVAIKMSILIGQCNQLRIVVLHNQNVSTSVVLVPLNHFSLVLVLVFGFEIILVSFSSSTASL